MAAYCPNTPATKTNDQHQDIEAIDPISPGTGTNPMEKTDMTLQVQKRVTTATLPARGSRQAAGYDLTACLRDEHGTSRGDFTEDGRVVLAPHARALIPTGLAFTVPEGTYGRIGPRSGLALKNGLDVLAGIIDRDYTGEIGVVIVNLGKGPFIVEHGMRIAQLVIERIAAPEVVEVDSLDILSRGGGFGSTGIHDPL